MRRIGIMAALATATLALLAPPGASQTQWKEHSILLKVGDKAFRYDNAQLRALATAEVGANRGTKKNPAIPLETILTKDTRISLDRILGVVVVGNAKILFLEGDNLQQVQHLVLKFGPNHLTLVPASDEVYERNRALWGKPRIEDVERIDIFERR